MYNVMYTLAIILKLVYAGGLRHLESRIFKMTFRRRGVKLLFYSCDIDFDLLKLHACYKKIFYENGSKPRECKLFKPKKNINFRYNQPTECELLWLVGWGVTWK